MGGSANEQRQTLRSVLVHGGHHWHQYFMSPEISLQQAQ